ncbi:prepilin-type N-terminal cleavage/methylation domain-containing protein [Candidatus Babeliales bacterium]|nr:prepilin-type N-terminal cleavage/methylation domain-containing protein [Candidatus Babeliales bacterium]
MHYRGFTFVEVVLTIALIGFILTPLLVVQNNVLRLVMKSSDRARRIFILKNAFSEAAINVDNEEDVTNRSFEKQYEVPHMSLKYTVMPIVKESSLKGFSEVYLLKAYGSWQRMYQEHSETMISFLFVPPNEKKESS